MASTGTGQYLYNRVACGEKVRVTLRKDWKDLAWGTEHYAGTITGCVISRGSHRMAIAGSDHHVYVIRRVDITAIEANLGAFNG